MQGMIKTLTKKVLPLVNLGLRGASMGGKFLLIFYIGKYFSAESLGVFGIFSTTVVLSIFLLGFDFYRYTTRVILDEPKAQQWSTIRDQSVFYLFTYLAFLPILSIIFFFDILDFKWFLYFYIVVILEHFGQELFRLFTVLGYPFFANFILFLRIGVWTYILLAYWYLSGNEFLKLEVVWVAWAIGAFLSIIVGVWKVLQIYSGISLQKVNWTRYIPGAKISLFYLISTIAYKVIEFSDRYMIDIWLGKESVGIYTFFNQIANLINVIVFTLIIMIYYPKLVKAYNEKKTELFVSIKKEMRKKVWFISLILSVGLIVIINPLLVLIDKSEFNQEIMTFYALILANLLLNVSFIPHYVLYAFKQDIKLFNITIFGAVVNTVLNFWFINQFGIVGAGLSTAISFALIWICKQYFEIKQMKYLIKYSA